MADAAIIDLGGNPDSGVSGSSSDSGERSQGGGSGSGRSNGGGAGGGSRGVPGSSGGKPTGTGTGARAGGAATGGNRSPRGVGTGEVGEPTPEEKLRLGGLGPKVASGGDKRPEYRVLAQATLCTIFNSIEVATQHPHWHKEAEDVEPVVGPLCRMIEQLPKSTLKAFEKRFNGIMLAGGLAFLVVPDTIAEVKIRQYERAIAKEEKDRNLPPGTLLHQRSQGETPAGNGGYPAGDANFGQERSQSNGDGKWTETLAPPDLAVTYKLPGN